MNNIGHKSPGAKNAPGKTKRGRPAHNRINDRDFLIIGGAYSVDKPWRLQNGYNWFSDEQLTDAEMSGIKEKIRIHNYREDIILAHTCPYDNRPVECFISGVDETSVDTSMERFLEEVGDMTEYNEFYCGHWHIDKQDSKIRFLYRDIVMVE